MEILKTRFSRNGIFRSLDERNFLLRAGKESPLLKEKGMYISSEKQRKIRAEFHFVQLI